MEVQGETLIDLPIDQCWDKLKDYSAPHNYVPDVLDTKIIGDQKEGVGALRKVYMPNATDGLDETVIEWNEGSGFTIRMHKGDKRAIPIFDEIRFQYLIKDAGNNQTWFRPTMMFKPRFGLRTLSNLLIKKQMVKTLAVIGQSMKEFYETGQPTRPERIKEIKAGL